jgi:hypothetical protein
MTTPRKALGLILPVATRAECANTVDYLDDGPATAGIRMAVDTMSPAYRVGDVALVRPSETADTGNDYVLRHKGTDTYRLVRVERITPTYIFGRQYNPPMLQRLPRKTWEPAYKVIGAYRARHVPGGAQ